MEHIIITNNMKDIHSHILHKLDDGAISIDESIDMLYKLIDLGFDEVILTPHYIDFGRYTFNNKEKKKLFDELNNIVIKNNMSIKIYLGNEIYMSEDILDNIKKEKINPLNNSKYILVEFQRYTYYEAYEDIFEELMSNGYKVIIAHPERYSFYQKNPKLVLKLHNMGVEFQSNYGSIINLYGKEASKCFKKLLKMNVISYLGTDVHHINDNVLNEFEICKKKIIKIIGLEKFKLLSNTNIKNVIENKKD